MTSYVTRRLITHDPRRSWCVMKVRKALFYLLNVRMTLCPQLPNTHPYKSNIPRLCCARAALVLCSCCARAALVLRSCCARAALCPGALLLLFCFCIYMLFIVLFSCFIVACFHIILLFMRINDVVISIIDNDTGEILNSRSFLVDLANPQRCINYFKSTLYRLSIKDFQQPIIFQCVVTPHIYAKQYRELDLF